MLEYPENIIILYFIFWVKTIAKKYGRLFLYRILLDYFYAFTRPRKKKRNYKKRTGSRPLSSKGTKEIRNIVLFYIYG